MAGHKARDPEAGASPVGRRKDKRRRSRKEIAAWITAAVLALVVLAGALVYWRLNGNLSTFDGSGLSKDRPDASSPDANGHTPVNLLLIGSDSRDGANKDLGGGDDDGARSDTTILLHVYADHRHAVGVSIPRDSLVDIPPCMLPNKTWTKPQTGVMFNSAFSVGNTSQGNPACTQNTVEKMTNLRIDHTIVVNFQGFAAMTSAVGGVTVCVPKAVYEGDLNPNLGHKGKEIFPQGLQKVSGQQALDYVRLRHGIGDGSDIGRTKRQQAFLSALAKDVKSRGMDPTTLFPLADAATKSLTVDPGLGSAQKLLGFAMSLKDIDLHDMKFVTMPWRYQGARVAVLHPDADQLWAALKADRTLDGQDAGSPGPSAPAPTPSPTTAPATAVHGGGTPVAVYNGTTTGGLTTRAAALLEAADFTVSGKANASTRDHRTTVVEYGPGEKAKAEQVAALFPGATLEAGTKAGLALVLGADFATGGAEAGASVAPPPPGPLPTSVTQAARSADDDPCADLSYG
ncbi:MULTISPECIES: LCP family protein [Kitasatospora]|uniref:LCP family protein required for cell wall assembly n=2 Tax=Kitasatospora TaxID=2063 RepID=A0ABT1J3S9_9ACTN|nr:LCP family protein [Kitasatospora paracochleata]MCP2312018.1 LCP family protein required for cell wall assembly [Kitasatospora paracochleata]